MRDTVLHRIFLDFSLIRWTVELGSAELETHPIFILILEPPDLVGGRIYVDDPWVGCIHICHKDTHSQTY